MQLDLTKHQSDCLEMIHDQTGEDVAWLAMGAGTTPQAFGRAGIRLSELGFAYRHGRNWHITSLGRSAIVELYPWMTEGSKGVR